MKILLSVLVSCFSALALCQIPNSNKKKIQKILGSNFVEIPAQKSYLPYFKCPECTPDTSMVFIGKSDGAIKNKEFILYRNPISFIDKSELYKAISSEQVTTEEYNEFESWVRDSISMEKIYNRCDIPYYDFPFLIRDKRITYYEDGKPIKTYNASRDIVREDITFDRSHQLDYSNPQYIPSLSDMYMPQPMRYLKMQEFWKINIIYAYTDHYHMFKNCSIDTIETYFPSYQASSFREGMDWSAINRSVPVMRAEYELGKRSQFLRDYYSVLAILGAKVLKESPAFGMKGFQADAFCHWKTEQLQADLYKRGLEYKVIVTLPTADDSDQYKLPETKLSIPKKKYSMNWRITNSDYLQFMEAVSDSIIRERLFLKLKNADDALKFIHYSEVFFDEGSLEYVELDKFEDRKWLREQFSLNYRTKINKMTPEMDSIVNELLPGLSEYVYFEIDAYDRSFDGIYEPGLVIGRGDVNHVNHEIWGNASLKINGEPNGKDHRLGGRTILGESSAIRTHINLQRFINRFSIDVTPYNGSILPDNDEIAQMISYDQALAYYNWKYPIHKFKDGDNWQDFVYPSKEQFLSIQNGEEITIDNLTIDYPSPTFRYVVHLFAK